MGAVQKLDIYGAKGGSDKPKTPTEAPDSLRSVAIAKMLIAVGEGEFEGTPTAKDTGSRSTATNWYRTGRAARSRALSAT